MSADQYGRPSRKPSPAICSLPAGHAGDCNGFPRLLGPDELPSRHRPDAPPWYCRPLERRFDPDGRVHVPYSGPRTKTLGEYVRERLDLIEAHEATIAEMRVTIERLERAIRNERAQ